MSLNPLNPRNRMKWSVHPSGAVPDGNQQRQQHSHEPPPGNDPMTADAIDAEIIARLRTPPGKPTDVRLYLTLRLIERAANAVMTDDGVLVIVGQSGQMYPKDLAVVDELERLGWIETHSVDAVTVTPQGAWWSKRFGDMNRVRR